MRRPVLAALTLTAAAAASALVPAAHAAALAGPSGSGCRAALTRGEAVVTRSTVRIGDGAQRYHTAVVLTTTGDPYRLVVDRGVGRDPLSQVVNRVQRGAAGDVTAPRAWGFGSRTGTVIVHVAGVDTATGQYFRISC